jgi:endonuclease/exonuclease/phosphatase family metal-dependent hydrolase
VGGPIGVRSVETVIDHEGGRYPSDHYPVLARLELR